ncbi:hypothetical protein N2382_08175 [SAR92 clade bacterium H921]|nr:hypothetical protein [SAR92 clade bacterium H921]
MEAKEIISVGITISDWLMILAVISGPVIAVQIQKYIDGKSETRNRRLKVFSDLMITRNSTTDVQHVSALTMVGLEFNEKEYGKVVNAWENYLGHLRSPPNNDDIYNEGWRETRSHRLTDLLFEMSDSLGFGFDKAHIMKTIYNPVAFERREFETDIIRHKLATVFLKNASIPIAVTSVPSDDEALGNKK